MKFPSELTFMLLLLTSLLAACETVVEIDLPEEPPRLTLNAMVGQALPWRVRVAESMDVLEVDWNTQFSTPQNTQVIVSGEEGEIELVYEPYCISEECNNPFEEGQGLFVMDEMRPIPGKTYTVTASAPGFETVTATERVPDAVPISDITLNAFSQTNNNDGFDERFFFEASISWDDPADEANYYMIETYAVVEGLGIRYDSLGNEIGRDTLTNINRVYLKSNDPIVVEASSYVGVSSGRELLFADGTFNGQRKTIRIFENSWGNVRKLIFVLRNISESYWRYYLSYDEQYWADGNPLAQPVQVFSNVNNGYGLFAAFSADSVEVIPDE